MVVPALQLLFPAKATLFVRPIIINLEKIETETAKKIFDFLSGATYALNGSVQKIANNIFIFAPESVDIAASQEDRGGFDFGANKSPWR